ncbi:abortive infection system antitoxin AbiGi family protein [Tundrisphaera sp. TA3]|uniref:abortive infection system antitoxin AbiGi family protein n=1 Tax=Tundrisphaera sp. TA3 TaxID=3435775 RepID=UPI003EBF2C62
MSSSPGTVSKILWHFTGGPIWNAEMKCQENRRKPASRAYWALKAILSSRELRVGQYHEVVKYKVFVPEGFSFFSLKREPAQYEERYVMSLPINCLADIPIMHLGYHSARYGKMAIGFHRHAAIKHGFNPVFYQHDNSEDLRAICAGAHALDVRRNFVTALSLREEIDKIGDIPTIEGSTVRTQDSKSFETILSYVDKLESATQLGQDGYARMLAQIKTFREDEFGTIYCEREWRSTKTFAFSYSDVAMIALPKGKGNGNYFERFIAEAKEIGLPPTVSIVAWDDLVEH